MRKTLLAALALAATGALSAPARASEVEDAVTKAIAFLLEVQEGEPKAEWPYEGVYRVKGIIPIGYRIGGTSIVGTSLIESPGYGDDEARQAAIARATAFVTSGVGHPLMAYEEIKATYDVRGWGYAWGLNYLLRLKTREIVPKGQQDAVEKAIAFYIAGIQKTAIPQAGGWNYARRAGFTRPAPPSPFMTGTTLQALFDAKAQGYEVDPAVIEQGVGALQRARTQSGSFVYSGDNRRPEPVPGSVGRMLIAESTLLLAGKGSPILVRGALDAFFVHWKWLDKRRAQNGTHIAPYGVAPYYFYFAHYYAAQAIELLPERERDEYRRLLRETIFSVQLDDGTWNDRVFKRTANYGTAFTIMALQGQTLTWPSLLEGAEKAPKKKAKQKPTSTQRFK